MWLSVCLCASYMPARYSLTKSLRALRIFAYWPALQGWTPDEVRLEALNPSPLDPKQQPEYLYHRVLFSRPM